MSLRKGKGRRATIVTPPRLRTGTKAALDRLRHTTARQRRTVFFSLVFALVFGLTLNAFTSAGAWSVVVAGEVIATVDNRPEFEEQLGQLLEEIETEIGREVVLASDVSFVRADAGTATVAASAAAGDLRDRLPLATTGVYVVVDGVPAVACDTRQEAEAAVALLMDEYVGQLTAKAGVDVSEVKFQEEITYQEGAVAFAKLKDVSGAVQVLKRGTDKVVEYAVAKGDTIWGIARKTGISESNLRLANQQVKGDLIHPGDKLNLVVPDPYLNLASTEIYVYKQSISFPTQVQNDPTRWPWERIITQSGRSGQKEVTDEIVRVNGEEVSRTRISETLISSPVTQMVIQGTKIIPDHGTGTLIWQAVGGINSPYGMRGREMHTGIDIGAPRGSSVMAADNGTVTEARYAGNYGNCIRIDHGGGSMITLYAHLLKMNVKVGDVVTKGQVIGTVGSTGRSTGNHLHFEVRINGKPVNPIQFYPGK